MTHLLALRWRSRAADSLLDATREIVHAALSVELVGFDRTVLTRRIMIADPVCIEAGSIFAEDDRRFVRGRRRGQAPCGLATVKTGKQREVAEASLVSDSKALTCSGADIGAHATILPARRA